ncbi:MAG: hypothetical protein WBG16_10220 [Bradyrhizobium sp.]|jgi:hypothetical protein
MLDRPRDCIGTLAVYEALIVLPRSCGGAPAANDGEVTDTKMQTMAATA